MQLHNDAQSVALAHLRCRRNFNGFCVRNLKANHRKHIDQRRSAINANSNNRLNFGPRNNGLLAVPLSFYVLMLFLMFFSLLLSQIRIRVGEYDFSNVQEDYPYVERGAARKAVHPKYNFFTYEYDLALVRLEASVDFAPHISPVCLPASDDLLVGENATVTGWGRLSEGGSLPSVLQEVRIRINFVELRFICR